MEIREMMKINEIMKIEINGAKANEFAPTNT